MPPEFLSVCLSFCSNGNSERCPETGVVPACQIVLPRGHGPSIIFHPWAVVAKGNATVAFLEGGGVGGCRPGNSGKSPQGISAEIPLLGMQGWSAAQKKIPLLGCPASPRPYEGVGGLRTSKWKGPDIKNLSDPPHTPYPDSPLAMLLQEGADSQNGSGTELEPETENRRNRFSRNRKRNRNSWNRFSGTKTGTIPFC